jgi:hypothetical protein
MSLRALRLVGLAAHLRLELPLERSSLFVGGFLPVRAVHFSASRIRHVRFRRCVLSPLVDPAVRFASSLTDPPDCLS